MWNFGPVRTSPPLPVGLCPKKFPGMSRRPNYSLILYDTCLDVRMTVRSSQDALGSQKGGIVEKSPPPPSVVRDRKKNHEAIKTNSFFSNFRPRGLYQDRQFTLTRTTLRPSCLLCSVHNGWRHRPPETACALICDVRIGALAIAGKSHASMIPLDVTAVRG